MYEQKNILILARALLATKPSLQHLVQNTKDVTLGRIITSCIVESYTGEPEWRSLAEAIEEEALSQGRLKHFTQPYENGDELYSRHVQTEYEIESSV
jgi:hypothetical protein